MKLTSALTWSVLRMSVAASFAGLAAAPGHSRPDFHTRDGPRTTLSLNGEWDVLPVKDIALRYPPPSAGWEKERVPHRQTRTIRTVGGPYMPTPRDLLNEDGTGFKQTDRVASWFRRSFAVSAAVLKGRRAILHFHGVAFRSDVWLNGERLGRSYQCTIPIEYDVTDVLKAGAANDLLVGVAGREGLTDVESRCFIAPSNGVSAGIWGDVELRFLPEFYIEDVFVKTSVRKRRLDLEVTLVNAGRAAAEARIESLVRDAGNQPECSFGGGTVRLAPGRKKVVTLSEDWIAPRLWSPETPVLYSAEIALRSGRQVVDVTRQRFGFREFEIRGRDFFLNGVRTVLLRNSSLTMISETYQGAIRGARRHVDRPFNCVRLHLGFNNEDQLDLYDRAGMLAVPEASWNWTNRFPSAKKDIWLPHVLDYFRGWVRLHRNRPSVVMWSLCNETYWDRRDPADMEIAEEILAAVRALDPTRPQQGDGETSWGGRLPVINIHYPESTAGDVRQQFPNSGLVVPNDLYWLKNEGENAPWRARFVWDRPLVVGEYWWASGDPDSRSSFMGEAAFDWERWRFQKFAGGDRIENPYIEVLKMATDYYRMKGVAGINPWSSDRNIVMKPVAVRPVDFHPNFYGGEPGVRKVVVFNDTQKSYYRMNLHCRLTVGGRSVWKSVIRANVRPGEFKTFDVPIGFPAVASVTGARLLVRLRYWRGGGMNELARYEEDVFVMPRERLGDVGARQIVLLDTNGQTQKALSSLGLPLRANSAPPQAALRKARLVIVGRGTDASAFGDMLVSFVRGGGHVIVLQQENWRALCSELPESDDKHAASRSWRRSYDHPVLAGMDDGQFSYWRPDNLVARKTFHKPVTGRFRVLLDSGGRYGMQWSPLVEVACDKGVFLLSQLNLVDRAGEEPLAGALLGRMIRYCLAHEPAEPSPLRVLSRGHGSLDRTLAACSVVTERSLKGDGPILLDATYTPSAEELEAVKSHLRGGGSVWLHGFGPETIGNVAPLFPFEPELATHDETVQSAARRSDDPLVDNLSTFDFFWTRVDIGAREDYFQKGQPTAKLGGHVLKLPSLGAGTPLIEPALLVKVPVGEGTLLFDSLLWEDAFGTESDKVARIVSSLVTSLGGDIRIAAETEYDYFHVDISKHATMGYYDQAEGDGRGGWTDQGPNDMRFFLINHVGKAGGREDGPEVGVEEFPTLVRLAKRPFTLVDAKENDGRAVITLRGGGHCPFLPSEAQGIPVGEKAVKLWFLHTACWAIAGKVHQEIARYTVHYEDGSMATVPVRFGLEVADWWDPAPLANGVVAWTGKNLAHSPVGIWASSWENPHPEKTIASIDVTGNLTQAQLVVLAITGGVAAEWAKAERTISRWVLAEAKDGLVPNRVAGAAPLRAGKNAPTEAKTEGRVGLRFSEGQALTGDSKRVPGFLDGLPFSLEVTLAAERKPSGYYGGVFQCMDYRKNGFRLVQKQDMKLTVEVFPGPDQARYISGKTPLKTGRFYKVRVEFDGERGYLFVDGKLDGSTDTPLPAPCRREMLVGTASGKDYHFNGVVAEIAITVPVERDEAVDEEPSAKGGGDARSGPSRESREPVGEAATAEARPGLAPEPRVSLGKPAAQDGNSTLTLVLIAAALAALAAAFLVGRSVGAGSRRRSGRRR